MRAICGPAAYAAAAALASGAACIGSNCGQAVYDSLVDLLDPLGNVFNNEDPDPESCPSNSDDWEKISGSDQAYRPKGGKEPIFEKERGGDRSHGGSDWKKWDKKRDWEKEKPRNGTYDSDGNRLRD